MRDEIEHVVRPDIFKRYQSDHFKVARDDKSIPEHVLFLAKCWPDFGSDQIYIMLKIQRQDESIPLSDVTDVIGKKLSYEERFEFARRDTICRLMERKERKLKIKERSGTVGVWATCRGYWESDYMVLGKKKSFTSSSKKITCDWYDSMERANIPEEFRVLNEYKESRK